ncbi:CbrC family protein [Shewanella sp.]|uniref:CbrC family protein n=1 Tax=Shewanella sp. TaxID=50422 RepID=UPI003A9783E7
MRFKYIHQMALADLAITEHCQCCGEYKPIYRLGREVLINEQWQQVDELCADCLQHVTIKTDSWLNIEVAQRMLNRYFPKGSIDKQQKKARATAILDELLHTPAIVLELSDWPHCCADYAPFSGKVGHSYQGDIQQLMPWPAQEAETNHQQLLTRLIAGEDPVLTFSCPHCGKRYWLCQPS